MNALTAFFCVVMIVSCSGCKKDRPSSVGIPSLAEAALQLDQTFTNATVELRNIAAVAAEGMRTADYTKAIYALRAIKSSNHLSADQSIAIQESEVAIVAGMNAAINSGDTNAKQAYELYKKRD